MSNELYHRRAFGRPKKDHKYTRREWKNGHWVYYYDDGTTTKDYPKGQNYKTSDRSKRENAIRETLVAERNSTDVKRQTTVKKLDDAFNRWVDRGETVVDSLLYVLSSRPVDILRGRRADN